MTPVFSSRSWITSKFITGFLALVIPSIALDCRAATIAYTVTDLVDEVSGEDLWLYTYRVSDFNFGAGQGFNTTFVSSLFTKLQTPPSLVNADWDALTLQPDLLLSSAGLYDAQALRNTPSLANDFKVTAVWLGTGTPGSQSFTIYDSNFATIEQGQTAVILPPQSITFPVLTARTTSSPAFNLTATASSGLPVSFNLVSGPATVLGSTVTLTGSVGTVVIRATQAGSTSFAAAAPVERSFVVTLGNQAPSATAANVSTPEDAALLVVLSGTDPESSSLSYATVALPAHGTLTGSPPNLTYQPNSNYNGTDSFTFRVNDGQLNSAPVTVNLTITPVNDLPVAGALNIDGTEDTPVALVLTGADIEGSALTFSIVSGPANGTLGGTLPNLTYQPNTHFSGADSFTFRVNDGFADSAPAIVNLAITAVNDPPVAITQSAATAENTPVALVLTGADTEGGPLAYSIVTPPANGTLTGNPPNLNYLPNANFNGTDSLTFLVNDGSTDSAPATVNLTITAVNDIPIGFAQSAATTEDTPVALVLTGGDSDGSSLAFSIVSGPSNGTLTGNPPNLTYQPNPNYNGADSFTFRVNDGTTDSAPTTVNLTVAAVNDPPAAIARTVTTKKNTRTLAIILSGTDADGDALTYQIVKGPKKGKLTGKGPKFTYKPKSGFISADTFTFLVNDGTVASGVVKVSIKISAKTPKVTKASAIVSSRLEETVVSKDAEIPPLPWRTTDVGGGASAGFTSYQAGNFLQTGAGSIAADGDHFQFTYQTLSGDGEIVAHVDAMADAGSTSRAGVMIRDSLGSNAAHAFIGLDATGSFHLKNRKSTWQRVWMATAAGQSPSSWVRLLRRDNLISAYTSADGSNWIPVGTIAVPMANHCYIGLAASDGGSATLSSFRFSHVSVTP